MNLLDEGYLDAFNGEGERLGASNFFDTTADFFNLFGFGDAAKKLRHYRDGNGTPLTISDDEMARHPAYGDAVDYNRTRFETDTFTGRADNGKIGKSLLAIPDGGSANIRDLWDRKTELGDPSSYLNFGRYAVQSRGDFQVSRKGNKFFFQGNVGHHLGANSTDKTTGETNYIPETFDFNQGQPGKSQADIAERYGDAAKFIMLHPKQQQVSAEVTYDPKNNAFIVDKTSWLPLTDPSGDGWWRTPGYAGDIKPVERPDDEDRDQWLPGWGFP